jgi:hypothetical protein
MARPPPTASATIHHSTGHRSVMLPADCQSATLVACIVGGDLRAGVRVGGGREVTARASVVTAGVIAGGPLPPVDDAMPRESVIVGTPDDDTDTVLISVAAEDNAGVVPAVDTADAEAGGSAVGDQDGHDAPGVGGQVATATVGDHVGPRSSGSQASPATHGSAVADGPTGVWQGNSKAHEGRVGTELGGKHEVAFGLGHDVAVGSGHGVDVGSGHEVAVGNQHGVDVSCGHKVGIGGGTGLPPGQATSDTSSRNMPAVPPRPSLKTLK